MEQLQSQLDQLNDQGLLRTLRRIDSAQGPRVSVADKEYLLLCSNNYLGLANHPQLVEAAVRATREFGTGSGASRLVSGSMALHHQLEERIAQFKGTEAALVFNSGYAANNGIIQGLLNKDDLVFSDALNHASIIDGCRLSGARTLVFEHNNMASLETLLKQESANRKGRWMIVVDGVFSMDGDLAPLAELVRLKQEYDAWLMVDDAHGGGVLGTTGRGTAEQVGCMPQIDLQMGTFGKAFGSFGAYVAAREQIIDMLINRARSLIYSTSLPPGVLAANLAAIELVSGPEGEQRRRQLETNRALFSSALERSGLDLCGSQTQIVPILIGDPVLTMQVAAELFRRGIYLSGIRPPTVPAGTCRLRATLMADHTPEELQRAAEMIVALVSSERIHHG